LLLLATAGCSHAPAPGPVSPTREWDGSVLSKKETRVEPRVGSRGMVVADDAVAAAWGAEVLRKGGNTVDAAVATGFALAVTRPHYASLGGGGFMLYCPKSKPCEVLDYRETAPAAATRDMYLRDGKARTDLSRDGALASGVPGVPAGLSLALERWGKLPRRAVLKRAIELAREGTPLSGNTEYAFATRAKAANDEARRLFGGAVGSTLVQADLARVLQAIEREGAAGFYRGPVARALVDGLRAAGGILTLEDLDAYRPKLRTPLYGSFGGMEIVTMPPPSAGGGLILELLGFVERADRQGQLGEGYGSARAIHALAHGMALGFADRAELYGDPDFVSVPIARLLAPEYLDARWASFRADRAENPAGAGLPQREGSNTTHFSVIDAEGNAVAVTTTVNEAFGSAFVPPGTGVVMNNEMDDFSIQPGAPNRSGLVGAEANSIAPGKRSLSSMSPTIVRDGQGRPRLVLGAAGGPRITTSVFLALVNRLRFGMSLPDAVAAPRFHHQWKPDELKLERDGFSWDTRARLEALGYPLSYATGMAWVHALERFPNGRTWGVPDTRGEGAAAAE